MNKNSDKVTYLLGSDCVEVKPLEIFSDIVREFLDELSKELRNDVDAKRFPDIMTFAFWCRKANIEKIKNDYLQGSSKRISVGRGIAFHIAPSNVPINFAFTLVFGMLAGNANIVRASSKDFEQTRIVCRAMSRVLEKDKYEIIKTQNSVVMYDRNKDINDMYSEMCDVRVIWGGDNTIAEIRKSPIKSRCTEITFADRYSFALFDEKSMENISDSELTRIVEGFYNDTYLMDQNACSSPHLIIWKKSEERKGRYRFYDRLANVAHKYKLEDMKVLDKVTQMYEMFAQDDNICGFDKYDNLMYIVKLNDIGKNMSSYRGKYGLFFEYEVNEIIEFIHSINEKVQTCVSYGNEVNEIIDIIMKEHIRGIDRIVNPGQAMDMGIYWDGIDVIGNMSRMIVN